MFALPIGSFSVGRFAFGFSPDLVSHKYLLVRTTYCITLLSKQNDMKCFLCSQYCVETCNEFPGWDHIRDI